MPMPPANCQSTKALNYSKCKKLQPSGRSALLRPTASTKAGLKNACPDEPRTDGEVGAVGFMSWRSWSFSKAAVFGIGFGAGFAVVGFALLYTIDAYESRPKPWDEKSLGVEWNDLRYLEDPDGTITGFLFQYGIHNKTNRDYKLTKAGIKIMERTTTQPRSLEPAVFNLSLSREEYFLPASQTSLIELYYEGKCDKGGSGRPCFENYTKEIQGVVLLDENVRYLINLPKPERRNP
jgi:hypothetical protein